MVFIIHLCKTESSRKMHDLQVYSGISLFYIDYKASCEHLVLILSGNSQVSDKPAHAQSHQSLHCGRYFILPVPNSVSGTCLCNILRHKVSQHNFHNIHLLNVDSKFRDTEYEVRSPQESPCISIDQIISGQK